jgi:hypothetical protein
MKKIILGLAIMSLAACSNNESKMKAEIKTYLDKNAKDPKSYEFVDLKILDTVTLGEFAKKRIDEIAINTLEFSTKIIENETTILQHKQNGYSDIYKDSDANRTKINVSYTEMIAENKIDSLDFTKKINDKTVVGYVTEHNYRLKNGFGALDLSKSYVEFDEHYKLLSFGENLDYSVFNQKK